MNTIDMESWAASTIKISQNQEANKNSIQTPQQSQQPQDKQIVHDSSLSIYERVRHFLLINFVLNKRSFILSILSYLADLILFVALNLYLFSNKKFLYETICHRSATAVSSTSPTTTTITTTSDLLSISLNETKLILKRNLIDNFTDNNASSHTNNDNFLNEKIFYTQSRTIKQSYLTLQIISIFVFFICFLLSYLIKLQFKYHRLALNLYDYDVDDEFIYSNAGSGNANTSLDRDDGRDSLASTTTASHFSSSYHTSSNKDNNHRKMTRLLKRFLFRLLTKFAAILLHLFFGYQFCQNCFIRQDKEGGGGYDKFSIFTHVFILCSVLFRCLIHLLSKKNSMNKINHLKKLEQKQKELFDPLNAKNPHRFYYHYYYSYLIKSNQNACNQLRTHQINQNTFRILLLNEMSLFVGFSLSLFHLFSFLKAVEVLFVFVPVLLTLVLFRFKSMLNASANLLFLFAALFIISKSNSSTTPTTTTTTTSITTADFYQTNNRTETLTFFSCEPPPLSNSSTFNLISYNFLTFICFLVTFYFKSLLSIYYCTLTSLERWNLSFLSKLNTLWRKLTIYASLSTCLIFAVSCTIALSVKFQRFSFLLIPLFLFVAFLWCSFQLFNTINLTYLMNKINDCYLMLNDSNVDKSAKNGGGISPSVENASSNRHSTMSQSTTSHQPNNNNNNNNNNSKFKLTKFLSRFFNLNDNKLYSIFLSNKFTVNVPIHRILAYKGVRNLGSISYRISLYCLVQTLLLCPFAFNSNSSFTIGIYLTALGLNFIWINLLYQFGKSNSGNCIAYALVSPPSLVSVNNSGASTLSSNPTLLSAAKKLKTGASMSSGVGSTFHSNFSLPFNHQHAVFQRCNLLLHKIQLFLQFHLIENFGCDYAANGLSKEYMEHKMRQFFGKKSLDGSAYATYLFYYCGPTSPLTDSLTFSDQRELSIEEIVNLWKELNCSKIKPKPDLPLPATTTTTTTANLNNNTVENPSQTLKKNRKNSRLIILLDSENTAKNVDYVQSKINEPGVYVALQTCKYNYNNNQVKHEKNAKLNSANSKINPDEKVNKQLKPEQQQPTSLISPHLTIGKFTLDWIKSNSCNSYSMNTELESDELANNYNERYYNMFAAGNLDENRGILNEDDEDEDEDEEMSDEMEMEVKEVERQTINRKKQNLHLPQQQQQQNKHDSSSVFYETKCAFSRYWINFSLDQSDKSMTHDFTQLWGTYYPSWICRPLITIINCRLCNLRVGLLRRLWFFMRRLKNRVIPMHEFDTGHGFKLFSS